MEARSCRWRVRDEWVSERRKKEGKKEKGVVHASCYNDDKDGRLKHASDSEQNLRAVAAKDRIYTLPDRIQSVSFSNTDILNCLCSNYIFLLDPFRASYNMLVFV